MQAEPAETHIRLRAVRVVNYQGRVIAAGELLDVVVEEALPLVLRGAATLDDRQDAAPIFVLRALQEAIAELDRIGPRTLDTHVLTKIEAKILEGGRRRTSVEGRPLTWHLGWSQVGTALVTQLGGANVAIADVKGQLERVWKTKQEGSALCGRAKKVSPRDAEDQGLVLDQKARWRRRLEKTPPGSPLAAKFQYRDVGRSWAAFEAALAQFNAALANTCVTGLREGRLLCIEERAGGATLVAPWHWTGTHPRPSKLKNSYFLLSRDLPASWFPSGTRLKGPARQARIDDLVGLLHAIFARRGNKDRKLLKANFVEQAVQVAGVSESLAKAAWKQADIPNWKRKGRCTDQIHLTPSDFDPKETKR